MRIVWCYQEWQVRIKESSQPYKTRTELHYFHVAFSSLRLLSLFQSCHCCSFTISTMLLFRLTSQKSKTKKTCEKELCIVNGMGFQCVINLFVSIHVESFQINTVHSSGFSTSMSMVLCRWCVCVSVPILVCYQIFIANRPSTWAGLGYRHKRISPS